MNSLNQSRRKRAFLLATGQLTAYGSGAGVDDGALRKGLVKAYTVFATGQYAGTTNITINSKTDAHTNKCVFDNNTGMMWSQAVAASVGPASDGKLPWTNTGSGPTLEGIFAYCAAANAANLAGHNDWRVPNLFELMSIADYEATTSAPDATAFPSWPVNILWSSTTVVSPTTNAYTFNYSNGGTNTAVAKTTTEFMALVRDGNP